MCISDCNIAAHMQAAAALRGQIIIPVSPAQDLNLQEEVKHLEGQIDITSGIKYDQGKPRMDLLPMDALLEVAKVLTFGSKKYGDRNWEKGIERGRMRAAQMRHDAASEMGEIIDPESGLLHVAHKACDALMELALRLRKLDGADLQPRKGDA